MDVSAIACVLEALSDLELAFNDIELKLKIKILVRIIDLMTIKDYKPSTARFQ